MNITVELAAYFEESLRTPFEWGSHDCVLWCARWVDRLRGTQHEAAVRERYSYTSAKEALRLLHKHGFRALISEFLGEPVPPLLVPVGGIVLLKIRRRWLLGIKAPQQVLALMPMSCIAISTNFVVEGWSWHH